MASRTACALAATVVALGPLAVPAAAVAEQSAQACVTTPNPTTTEPWSQHRLQPERAWPFSRGGGVTVAVIDSGVDAGQPHLLGAVTAGPDLLGAPGGPSTADCSGHGTLVAGILAGRPLPGTPFHGVAPAARILSIRQNEQVPGGGPGRGDTTGMAAAIRAAVAAGAKVINISATAPADVPALRAAVDFALARDVVIVAAAGNDDPQDRSGSAEKATYWPAAYPEVLAVAGTDQADERSDTSHKGDYVDVAAPGKDVVSTGPRRGSGTYAVVSGTSFATPFVAGVAALVRSYRPGLRADQVVRRIVLTADPPPTGTANPQIGAGVVNPYAAVTRALLGEAPGGPAAPAASPATAAALPEPPARADTSTRDGALAAAGIAGAAAVLALALAAVLPRGRARRWTPGRREEARRETPVGGPR